MVQGYVTLKEIAQLLDCSIQHVSAISLREKWRFEQVGKSKLFYVQDVNAYLAARTRTEILKSMGFKIKGLFRDATYDTVCPVCRELAVFLPPTTPIEKKAWDDFTKNEELVWVWNCMNNHRTR